MSPVAPIAPGEMPVAVHRKRLSALEQERRSFDSHWREIADVLLPRRSRFFGLSDRQNAGSRRNDKILNGHGTRALRVLAAGMMAGVTSPARKWMRYITADPKLMRRHDVRAWLYEAEEVILQLCARSNVYKSLPLVYLDLGGFGTSLYWLDEDPDDVVRAHVPPVGSYFLESDMDGRISTVYRKIPLSVDQVVTRFGLEKCSRTVQDAYRTGRLYDRISIIHGVFPRRHRDPRKGDRFNMPYASVWFEENGADERDPFLHEGGYRTLPFMAPRWDPTGEDVYGTGPGMDSLGDLKGLQYLERSKQRLIDAGARPTFQAPAELKATGGVTSIPGGVNYLSALAPGSEVRPIFTPDATVLQLIQADIEEHKARISQGFLADLFLLFARADQSGEHPTAREVQERSDEKVLQLGPLLESIQDDLLDPMVERIFDLAWQRGMIPPPPPALEGSELRIELISIFYQAQRYLATLQTEKFLQFVRQLAEAEAAGQGTEALDRVDVDEMVTQYGLDLGVSPGMIRDDAEVAELRANRAQTAQAAQAAELAKAGRDAAQGIAAAASIPGGPASALDRMVEGSVA